MKDIINKIKQIYISQSETKRKKIEVSLTLGLTCFILVLAIMVQTKTMKNATSEIGYSIADNSNLRDEVLTWQNNNKKVYKSLEKLETELEKIRTEAISKDSGAEALEDELKTNNKLLGLTELKGEGVVITLDDNREVNSDEVLNINNYIVHAEDLLAIVNELFNAGADAVSINGQRIVHTTSIYCDGNIVRINGKMVGVPITISAIGHQERLYYALIRPEGYLEYKGYLRTMMEDGTKATIQKKGDILIPKYDGIYSYEYINR